MEGIIQDTYLGYLKTLPDGEYEIVVRKPTKKPDPRSIQQNKYLWGVVYGMVSEETGHSDEEIHEIFKVLFLSKYVEIAGKEMRITRSTTELDTKEFDEYCESIRMWCAQNLGLSIPEPGEET